jgi:hypothetical protein
MGIPLDDSGDWQATYQQLQSEGTGEDHSVRLIETPVFSRTPIRRGIDASMGYGENGGNGGAPTIPFPIRSSLAQTVTIFRAQISHYFSFIRRGSPEQLDAMGIGHLFAKTEQTPYMSPYRGQSQVSPKPTIRVANGLGRVGKGGIMGARPRFDRALRVIDYAYKPPVYGEGE